MNFFRKLRKFNVTEVTNRNDSAEVPANLSGRSSNGLRRSEPISSGGNGYHESETKLFEEAPVGVSSAKHVKNSKFPATLEYNVDEMAVVSPTPEALGSPSMHSSTANQFNLNNNYHLRTESHSHEPLESSPQNFAVQNGNGDVMDDSKVNRLMALYAAIIRGEKSEVKKLLTAYPDLLEAPDNFGRTPLMYCVLADRLDCAKLLLKMKCNLDQVDKAGRSALHLAAHKASYKFLELLQDRGGDIEMKDNDGQTPLHLTTRNHHARCLDFLLKHLSPGMVDVTDNQNRTALHWSAAFNNADYVKQLIKHNSNTDMPDAEGKTPLHWAANTRDPSAVATLKAILDHSSSVLNWQDYDGRTALHFAVAHENVAAVEYLLKFEHETCEVDRLDNSFRTPLHWAAQLGNTDIVKLLLSAGAKNSITDSNGATPLLYAALNNNSGVILEMIKHNVSVLEQADIEGRSALMWAAGKGAGNVIKTLLMLNRVDASVENSFDEQTLELIKELNKEISENSKMKQAVDANRTDNKGNTALHMAAWNGQAQSAELLLRNDARHDLQNNMNHTPLFGACEKGHVNVVKQLLECEASIDLTDHEERSPLHWAALGGHAEVCDLLIKKGLDPDLRDTYQRSPLHCAAFGGFINCMNLLLENGANVDLQDKEGLSALHWAAQSGHLDASKLLFQCSAFPNLMEFTEEHLTPLDHAMLNEREEVVQYLIEQGALSSEMIREIAAARIQAYYRGYQVRKDFASRKSLLMKHKELQKSKKMRSRRNMNNANSTDQLNCVAEETQPVPKSPNADSAFADSVCSDDESRPELSEILEPMLPIRTIRSSAQALTNVPAEPLSGRASDSENEDDDEEPFRAERSEDATTNHDLPVVQIKRYERPALPEVAQEAASSEHFSLRSLSVGVEQQSHVSSDIEMLKLGDDGNSSDDGEQLDERPRSAANDAAHIRSTETDPGVVTVDISPPDHSARTPVPPPRHKSRKEPESETPLASSPLSGASNPTNSDELKKINSGIENDRLTPKSDKKAPGSGNSNAEEKSGNENVKTKLKRKPKSAKPSVNRSPKTNSSKSSSKTSSPCLSPASQRRSAGNNKGMTPSEPGNLNVDSVIGAVDTRAVERVASAGSRRSAIADRRSSSGSAHLNTPTEPVIAKCEDLANKLRDEPAKPVECAKQKKTERRKKRKQPKGKDRTDHKTTIFGDIGDEDNITLEKVSGVAYRSDTSDVLSLHDDYLHETSTKRFVGSDLPLSEYIESLMNFSPAERKALETLQRNRKHAFMKANAAALLIQTAWKRYIRRKYPNRTFAKPKKKAKKQRQSKPLTTSGPKSDVKPDSKVRSTTSYAAEPSRLDPQPRQIVRSLPARNEGAESAPRLEPEPSCLPELPSASFSVKVSPKKKPRPHTSHGPQDSLPLGLVEDDVAGETETVGNLVEDCSDEERSSQELDRRKVKRFRPKTEHSGRRQHKLIFSSEVEANCEKLEQLCKIYGQTLVLHEMYYPTGVGRDASASTGRFRTLPAPSARPKTSKFRHQRDRLEDDFAYVNPIDLRDPVTAVQSFSPREWRSSTSKTRTRNTDSSRRSKSKSSSTPAPATSRKYRFHESSVANVPLQWQRMYNDLKQTSRSDRDRPTRFSYNMRNNNF